MSNYVFFYGGPFSQWASSPFTHHNSGLTFNCAEQFMMYNKAMLFNDIESADAIMKATQPWEQKAIGRHVKNFDDAVWMIDAVSIVYHGNFLKFTQNMGYSHALKETKGKLLVEASPTDTRWGIGMHENQAGIEDPANWKGENLLGKVLTQLRFDLFGQ